MRGAAKESAVVGGQGYWTPFDLAFTGITWTKAGVSSLDIWIEGEALLDCYAIADDFWQVDYSVYNENLTAILVGPTLFLTGNGILNGQVGYNHALLPVTPQVFAARVVFRGRGALVATTGGTMRVFARAGR